MGSEAFSVHQYGTEVCRPDKRPLRVIPAYHMVHFILRGQGRFNGRLLRAGQGFVCRQNRVAAYHPEPADPWEYVWMNVSGSEPDRILDLLPMEDDVFEWNLGRDAPLLCGLSMTQSSEVVRICDFEWNRNPESGLLHTALPGGDPARELACMSAFCRVAEGIIGGARPPEEKDYVGRAMRFFAQNFDQGVTVRQAADALGLSRAYLRNLFVEETGESPQACLMRLRMERAEQLLTGDFRIGEIADAVGYPDALQFSRIFRKYHGLSPSEYRAEARRRTQTR